MQTIPCSPFVRTVVLPLTLLAFLSGCVHKWGTLKTSPADYVREEQPSKLRVHLRDGTKLVVVSPEIEADTLTGFVRDTVRRIPLEDVARVDYRKSDQVGTALIVLLAVGALIAIGGASYKPIGD